MYESHYVAHFFRLWGASEGASGIDPEAALLGNSQNDFDALLGDLAGRVGVRFFLIEFKRYRAGFATEVGSSGKVHRHALYDHLRTDDVCRGLANRGHFAAYCDTNTNRLMFEPYAHAVAPNTNAKKVVGAATRMPLGNVLDLPSWCVGFRDFHSGLTIDGAQADVQADHPFVDGLGVNWEEQAAYIQCMYQHLEVRADEDDDHAVLGAYDPRTKEFRTFIGTVERLVDRLREAYDQMAKHIEANSPTADGSTSDGGNRMRM